MNKKKGPFKNEYLGHIIKHYRKKREYSLAALAGKTSLSASYINRLELGDRSNPSIEAVIDIASALNIPIDSLLGNINNEGEKTLDIESFFIYQSFSINDMEVSLKLKSLFSHLLENIHSYIWDEEEKSKEIFQLLKTIDKIKDVQKEEVN